MMEWKEFYIKRYDKDKSGFLMTDGDLTGYALYVEYPHYDPTCRIVLDKVDKGMWTNLGSISILYDLEVIKKITTKCLHAMQIGIEPAEAFLNTINEYIK